jgi:hypothetical protein
MNLLGHNKGPALEGGGGWKTHCWRTARAALLPILPVEVVRLRVNRAKELGLPYKTYAGIRAQTGHDVVAFLFSSNALGLLAGQEGLPARLEKLGQIIGADRIGLAVAPLPVAALAALPGLDAAYAAPRAFATWREARSGLRHALGAVPSDRVLLISDAPLEPEWAVAARLAGCLPARQYFA